MTTSLGTRIRKRREMLGMNQDDLAVKTGYSSKNSKSAISKIEKDINDLSRNKIKIFADALQTTEAYLMGWVDDPELSHDEALKELLKAPDNASNLILSKREKNHIKSYRKLNIEGKDQIDHYTTFISQSPKYIDETISRIVASIKYFDTPVSAGEGEFLDSNNYIMLDILETPPEGAEFIVRVCGNSMEPTYSDGDKLYIKPQEEVEVGEIGIFSVNGDVYVKERAADGLVSHNEDYKKIMFNEGDTLNCFGKVVGICENYR